MSAEPAPLSPSFRPALAPPRLGRAERVARVIFAVLAALLLAAWQIPPLLDWSRYRGTIATYAAARLGRPVSIAGGVRLALLPRPMLLADRVTLADRGDGISASIGTLRLEVALPSLLVFHVVPRTLSLDDARAQLPWPPPRFPAAHLPAHVTGAFSATVNGGTLAIGGMTLREVTASLRTDPETGAFAADGNARVAGLPWRFTALLGAAGADGVSPVSLTLDGRSAPRAGRGAPDMQNTGGAFHGRLLANGSMEGSLVLRGPDLSRLGGGPSLPWQASGAISADGLTLHASSLDLRLDQARGHAALAVHLAPPASLSVQAHIGQLPAGPWLWRLLTDASSAGLAADIDLGVDNIDTPATRLKDAHLQASAGAQGMRVHAASIIVPGGARLAFTGTIAPDGGASGVLGVQASHLHDTLGWLTGAALPLPPGVLSTADLRGVFAARGTRLTWSSLEGQVDGSPVSGAISASLTVRPALEIALSTQRLPLAGWAWPVGLDVPPLATLLAPFARADATITLAADQLDWPGLPLRHAVLQANGTPSGVTLRRLALDLPGGHMEASGSIGADASLSQARLDLTAPDAAALPAAWRAPAGLWQGGFHLGLTGAGPPDAIAVTLRADLGDLRAEAEGHFDAPARTLDATATLRHPGAPRLLAALGVADARAWLDDGSFAMLTHLSVSPQRVRARDFSVSAGALQIGGALEATLSEAGLLLRGAVDAPSLALPATLDGKRDLGWLRGLDAQVAIKADLVRAGLDPVATGASGVFLASGGVAAIEDGRASLPHGSLSGAVALDLTQDPPAFSLLAEARGVVPETLLPQPPSPPGLALQGGDMDVSADLLGHGATQAAVIASQAGQVHVRLHAAVLAGLDLQAAGAALAGPASGRRTRLQRALGGGITAPLDGSLEAQVTDGVAKLQGSRLAGPAGAVDIGGTVDGIRRGFDLRLAASPAGLPGPPLAVGLSGSFATARAAFDLGSLPAKKAPIHHRPRSRPGK